MEKWLSRFTGHNPYLLEINNSSVKPDVLRFYGREVLSEPFHWEIDFTCTQNITVQDMLMKFASFSMRSGKTMHGMVTGFDWLATTADQSHYRIRLESRLALLSRTHRSRVFQNLSVPEVVEQLLREHGYEGPDFEFRLTNILPERELITQWRESDLDFLRRILAETGIWFRSEMNNATEMEVLIFADSQVNYASGVSLPYREPSGLHDGERECVWNVRSWHEVVPARVAVRGYNYRKTGELADALAAVRSEAVTTGEHYRYTEPFAESRNDSDPEPESGAFFARLHHEREINHAIRLHLFSNSDGISPGGLLTFSGKVVHELKEGMVIRLVTYHGSRDGKLQVSLWGIPYSEQYCLRPSLLPRPEISGTLPARIESRNSNDIYSWLDEQGRYRVKLDMDRDSREPGYSYLWLRLAKPFAGDGYGWHMPLVQGTEVGIAFDGGDPDRPYIARAFHDSEHPEIVERDNRSQNILRTPARNELRMDDRQGAEHVALSTEYGKTQLNQGHITDAQGKQRGAGFELRTDEHGVIRVAKGLFITADGQQKAVGDMLEMDTALREIDLCLEQMKQLDIAMQQAQTLRADLDAQIMMFNERLKPLNELIHFAAPEGMAFASGEHLQMAATENIAINAGGDISAGAMEDISLMAGESAGLFAHNGKLSLIAGEGPLVMQAQNAAMELLSEKKLSMSAEQDMLFAAKKRITLIGGGSYLKIEAGKIEYGTTGRYIGKVKTVMKGGTKSKLLNMPALPDAIQNRAVDPSTGKPFVIPVYAKSCLREEGCTDAGMAEESADNFGDMCLMTRAEDCCGCGPVELEEPPQHAQSVKRRKPTSFLSSSDASTGIVASAEVTGVETSSAGAAAMTRIGGSAITEGVFTANPAVLWLGVLYAAVRIPEAGKGSDKVPGHDDYWYEHELRKMAANGEKATTRVRFFWQPDINGQMQVYGVHTGDGSPYEGVRVANMKWVAQNQRFEFTPAGDVDGPLITWTPERPDGSDLPNHTGDNVTPVDQESILVTPIPDNQQEFTLPPFPVPDEKDFNDYILVFPADSGVKSVYVYLKTARDEPGTATGEGKTLDGFDKWLEAASQGLGAPVPAQIADKLRGKSFTDFDAFRAEFWKVVAADPDLSLQFKPSNLDRMRVGKAPRTIRTEHAGKRKSYELHHVREISKGGKVMDLDNIRVATPKRHIDIHREVKNEIKTKI